jgi:hypothetical protein
MTSPRRFTLAPAPAKVRPVQLVPEHIPMPDRMVVHSPGVPKKRRPVTAPPPAPPEPRTPKAPEAAPPSPARSAAGVSAPPTEGPAPLLKP